MTEVKIDRHRPETEVQLRIVIEGRGMIMFQAVPPRPYEHVVKSPIIQIEIVRDVVNEADVVIPNPVLPDRAKTESDGFAAPPPDKITMSIRHAFARFDKIFARENFEFDRSTMGDVEIERINFVDHLATIVQHFERDRR